MEFDVNGGGVAFGSPVDYARRVVPVVTGTEVLYVPVAPTVNHVRSIFDGHLRQRHTPQEALERAVVDLIVNLGKHLFRSSPPADGCDEPQSDDDALEECVKEKQVAMDALEESDAILEGMIKDHSYDGDLINILRTVKNRVGRAKKALNGSQEEVERAGAVKTSAK
ncbi:hypothetical protein [Sorangium sp. So ce385]|uniref:hypothetical protein n=1 Tax=Sorangium sp. So ce385 TaxID=3133308 RepID=UPI003F5C257E